LQANRKTREGTSHPDRNAQFKHLNAQVEAYQGDGQPVISVDTKDSSRNKFPCCGIGCGQGLTA